MSCSSITSASALLQNFITDLHDWSGELQDPDCHLACLARLDASGTLATCSWASTGFPSHVFQIPASSFFSPYITAAKNCTQHHIQIVLTLCWCTKKLMTRAALTMPERVSHHSAADDWLLNQGSHTLQITRRIPAAVSAPENPIRLRSLCTLYKFWKWTGAQTEVCRVGRV